MTMDYEAVIGLEVHAELLTASKMFCGCSAKFGAPPNENTCPVCLGLPGSLPVVNRRAVEFAIRAGLATNCRVELFSRWARKNYFYPDLPKGYQISQYELPICVGGWIAIDTPDGEKRVRLVRIHMEEDTGKNIHDAQTDASLVDFNRSGVPLLEIVSEPDMRTAQEASAYLRKLRQILQYLGICDGNMEEGSFRCDANVSVRPHGAVKLGTKVEIKNMNSFRHVERAITFEIQRQVQALEEGETIVQETRLWDPDREVTRSMRSKEYAHDYRYFPEPDLPPVRLDPRWIEEIRGSLPELPDARRARFIREYGIPTYDADVLTSRRDLADYFEAVVRHGVPAKAASNWVMGDILRVVRERGLDRELYVECWPIAPEHLAGLIALIESGEISGKIAKTVFDRMLTTGRPPGEIVRSEGLVQITDENQLVTQIQQVLREHEDKVAEYRSGKDKLFGFFVGQVMKRTQGKANPQKVNELLRALLAGQ
ncbi:MAG: aspartyl/glutamyl-tRNA(Asn/Gln) amidotransferase subunit B [Candidatus Binatia bacterium]|nr:MAG: aspartyl/glutamyl-tRNA(Asn/Gln) amidotransferase subunit B [Candidatus Binatia bacterium]